jgi:hypothetical protein
MFILLISFITFLPACGSNNPDQTPYPTFNPDILGTSEPSVSSAPPTPFVNPFSPGDLLTVVISEDIIGANNQLEYMSDLAQAAGFALRFEAVTGDSHHGLLETYPNAIILEMISFSYVNTAQLGLIGDQFGAVREHAPSYYERAAAFNRDFYGEDAINFLPLDNQFSFAATAVLIRNDVYNYYGKEIRTVNEYEELLRWLLSRVEGVPAVAAPMYTQRYGRFDPHDNYIDWYNNGLMALNLFMPEMGYQSLASVFTDRYTEVINYVWLDEEGQAVSFFESDDAVMAMERFCRWRRDGLIDTKATWRGLTEYPTILANIKHLPETIDLTEYTLNILPDTATAHPTAEWVAMAAPEANIDEFLRFLEWMEDIDNYRWFQYGREGLDYHYDWETDVLITGKTAERYGIEVSGYNQRDTKAIFANTRFDYQLLDYVYGYPKGYVLEMTAVSPALSPINRLYAYSVAVGAGVIGSSWQNHVRLNRTLEENLLRRLYGASPPDDTQTLIRKVFDELRESGWGSAVSPLVNIVLEMSRHH